MVGGAAAHGLPQVTQEGHVGRAGERGPGGKEKKDGTGKWGPPTKMKSLFLDFQRFIFRRDHLGNCHFLPAVGGSSPAEK